MKTVYKRKKYFYLTLVVCLVSATLYMAMDAGGVKSIKMLTLAFSGPAKQVEMPEEWKKQLIKYQNWAKNADLAISLDQHLYPALLPFINKYAKENGLNIAVKEGTCGISGGLVSGKAVDIAGFCCPPGLSDRLPDLRFHTVGISALALQSNPDNPVDNITFEEAQQIYQRKIIQWSELLTEDGQQGPDIPIYAVMRFHCKKRPGHFRLLLENEDLFSPGVKTVGSIQDVMLQVYGNRGAIGGAETLYMADYQYNQDRRLKPLKINGYSASEPDHLISGKYPLYVVYSITTWEREGVKNPNTQKMVNYLLKEAKNIDKNLGIVPSDRLREAGWKFDGNELVGEPG